MDQTLQKTGDSDLSMLLELPVPFRSLNGEILVECQAFNGLSKWLAHFSTVTVCAPIVPERLVDPGVVWRALGDLPERSRLTFQPLPWGYHPKDHWGAVADVEALFERLIPRHRYLVFGNLGWLGSWGNVAADKANSLGRPYAVWLDWVLHDMPRKRNRGLLRNTWESVAHHMLKRRSLRAIEQSSLGLFHGRTVFEAYASYPARAEVVHDVHLSPADLISASALDERLSQFGNSIEVIYVGRVHPMKGPLLWIETIEAAIRTAPQGIQINATWFGGGPMLEECRASVAQRGLDHAVRFPGPENDRGKLLAAMRSADLFVFCHLTPESPRCLIEALMSGLPLLGFESAYASDLVAQNGGGEFVDLRSVQALATAVVALAVDKQARTERSRQAAASGSLYSDVAVFAHRSELIKAHLPLSRIG